MRQTQGTPYTLVGSLLNLANGGTGTFTITTDGDADFIDAMWTGRPVLAGAVANVGIAGTPLATEPDPSPNAGENNTMPSAWAVLVQVEMNGAKFFDAPVPWPTVFGDGSAPFIPLDRRSYPGNSTIKFTLTNNSGQAIDARVAIHGRKVPLGSA